MRDQILSDIQESREKKVRHEADQHLTLIGKRLRYIFNTPGLSDVYAFESAGTPVTHVKINDWSFYDEACIKGTSLTKHIPGVIKEFPELEAVCAWLMPFMTPYFNKPFELTKVQTLHELPYSKFPQVRYNPEATESFEYHIKHKLIPGTPHSLMLIAHPFILHKYVNLKLYFITHENILIDFFFWQARSEDLRVLSLPSSSSSVV